MNITQFRGKHPEYSDLSDFEIADSLHTKQYADLPREKFMSDFGVEDSMPAMDVASQALQNLEPSGKKVVSDLADVLMHPIDTASSLLDLGKGIVQLAIPGEQGDEETARAVGRIMQKRYGTLENMKRTLATDPVGFMSDFSAFLTGGGTALAKAGQIGGKIGQTYGKLPQMVREGIRDTPVHDKGTLAKRGQMGNQVSRGGVDSPDLPRKPNWLEDSGNWIAKAGSNIDPLRQTGRGIALGGKKLGNLATAVQGSLTGVGQDVMTQTFGAGLRNSKAWKTGFKQVEDADILVNEARKNIKGLAKNAKARYVKDLDQMVKSAPPTKWGPIISKLREWKKSTLDPVTGRHSTIKNPAEMQKIVNMGELINEVLSDKGMHNAAGFDFLKKQLSKVKISAKDMPDAARLQASTTQAVKSEIVNVYSKYDTMMDQYSGFKSLDSELSSAFGKDKHTSLDATLRKLQAAMRNQVNTSMGNKRQLLREIDPTQSLADKISGQAVRPIMPRGMAGKVGPMGVVGAGATAGAPLAAGLFALESPNLMGRANFLAGQAASPFKKVGEFLGPKGGRAAAQGLLQAGRVKRVDEQADAEMTLRKKAPKKIKKKKR